MIKKLLFNTLMFSSFFMGAQSFTASYSFAATTTVSGTTDPTPPPIVTGLTCGSFMAVGTPSANPNAAGRFSFIGWPAGSATGTVSTDIYANMTGSINPNEYYEVVLTPQSGYTVSLNSIAFTVQRSGAGIRSYVVRTSADGFTNNLPAAVLTGTNLSVVGTNEFFWNYDAVSTAQNGSSIGLLGASTTSSVSFRFYAWNSESLSGTFSIDNVVFNGSVAGTVTNIQSLQANSFNLYPNPSTGYFTIQSSVLPAELNVFDINGKQVLSQTISTLETIVDLSGIENGFYQLNIKTEQNSFNHKVMINK
ncbi:MAG: T9SS type A sorting domain-containing protein [Burkholderiales bacterium]|nr:T9SS type A sorting domain-containing protein [Bacteroidia bacterium]